MSRPAPLDHDFNKEKFADLLVSARGNNTQAKFADTIPMSPTYLSSYIRCRFDRPLMPALLSRIATASEGRVSFEDLLDASGYNPEKYQHLKTKNVPEKNEDSGFDYEREVGHLFSRDFKLRMIMGTAIVMSGFKNQRPDKLPPEFDAGMKIFDQPFVNWYQIFLDNPNRYKPENTTDLYAYGLQLIKLASVNDKVSFVTEDVDKFNALISQKIPALQIYVSAILVNISNYEVIKEQYIPTACVYSDNLPVLKPMTFNE